MASMLGNTPLDTRIALEADLPTKPYDAEIAYLESTGTQYINTGIVPTPTLSLDCSGYFPNGSPGMRFGSRASANSECFYAVGVISNNANLVRYSFGASGTGDELQRYTAAKPHRRFVLNAATKSVFIEYSDGASEVLSFSQSAFTGSFPLFLLAFNNSGTASVSVSGTRLSACRIFDGSTLVRDFQPVRVGSGSSAVGYLYDRVSGQLFGNEGTDAFVLGADLPPGFARVAQTGDVADLVGIESYATRKQVNAAIATINSNFDGINTFLCSYFQPITVNINNRASGYSFSSDGGTTWDNKAVFYHWGQLCCVRSHFKCSSEVTIGGREIGTISIPSGYTLRVQGIGASGGISMIRINTDGSIGLRNWYAIAANSVNQISVVAPLSSIADRFTRTHVSTI